jgi:hypothetical protein
MVKFISFEMFLHFFTWVNLLVQVFLPCLLHPVQFSASMCFEAPAEEGGRPRFMAACAGSQGVWFGKSGGGTTWETQQQEGETRAMTARNV